MSEWMLNRLRLLPLFLIDQPALRCPACGGAGGEMMGYYEPEFQECSWCYPSWERLDDHGVEWAVGRLSPLRWVRARFFVLTGQYRLRWWLGCRMGFHSAVEGVCSRCYKDVRR